MSKKELYGVIGLLEHRISISSSHEKQPCSSTSARPAVALSMKEKLWGKIKNIKNSPPAKSLTLKEQFKRYLSGEELTTDLLQLKALLESMSPASVEAERDFSAAEFLPH